MPNRFIIFERDSSAYHCTLIHEGIRQYFNSGKRELTFLPLGLTDLESVLFSRPQEKAAAISWLERPYNLSFFENQDAPYINLIEAEHQSNRGLKISFQGEGVLAADLFIDELKLNSIAYVGMKDLLSHQRRAREYRETAHRKGLTVTELHLDGIMLNDSELCHYSFNRTRLSERHANISHLLKTLPRPAGIFCGNDRIALNLYYYAEQLGIDIPTEVNLLGIGCLQRAEEGGVHFISVVQTDFIKLGYQAAKIMEEFILSGSPPNPTVLKPDGIIHRSTTSRRAVKDSLIHRAFELIDHDRTITVQELSDQLGVSRRSLENRFLTATNLSVGKAIDYERFRAAKQLLRSKQYNYEAIASLAGYHNHRQMLRSFDRIAKMSPSQYFRAYLSPD